MCGPGTSTRTSTPRSAASHSASMNAGRGAKYAAVRSSVRLAEAMARKYSASTFVSPTPARERTTCIGAPSGSGSSSGR